MAERYALKPVRTGMWGGNVIVMAGGDPIAMTSYGKIVIRLLMTFFVFLSLFQRHVAHFMRLLVRSGTLGLDWQRL